MRGQRATRRAELVADRREARRREGQGIWGAREQGSARRAEEQKSNTSQTNFALLLSRVQGYRTARLHHRWATSGGDP